MNENDFGLRDVIGLIRRQYRLILLTVVLVLGTAGGVTFMMKPIYSASALVLVDTTNKNLLAPETAAVTVQDSPRIDSEVELVVTDSILQRVLQEEHLIELPEFAISPAPGIFSSLPTAHQAACGANRRRPH